MFELKPMPHRTDWISTLDRNNHVPNGWKEQGLYYDDMLVGTLIRGRAIKIKSFRNLLNKLYNKDLSNAERLFAYRALCLRENGLRLMVQDSEFKRGHETGINLFDVVKSKMIEPFDQIFEHYTNEYIKAIPLKEIL